MSKSKIFFVKLVLILYTFDVVLSTSSCETNSDCGSPIKYSVCDDNICSVCEYDAECKQRMTKCLGGFCTLRPLFKSFNAYDIICGFSILIGAIIAAGGGLGGGGVFVPLYVLLLGFQTKAAAALSQATIFGGSMVNLIMNLREYHPLRKHRPLPDTTTILIFEPMLLIGTIIGVILNVLFPDPLILVLLVVTLTYATVRTTRKGIRMWREESEGQTSIGKVSINTGLNEDTNANAGNTNTNTNKIEYYDSINNTGQTTVTTEVSPEANETTNLLSKTLTEQELKQIAIASGIDDAQCKTKQLGELKKYIDIEKEKLKPYLIMFVVWIVVSMCSLIKNVSIFNVSKCSTLYWILTFAIPFPLMILVTLFMVYKAYNAYKNKILLGWIPANGDIEWSFNKSMLYPMIAILAGILGGLLGIGGGMIVSPLLIELGCLPRVAAATSALAVLVTSSSATLQFLLLNYLSLDFMFFYMIIGIIGTYIGQTIVNISIKKYGRVSIIIFAVASIMGCAIILMGIEEGIQIFNGETSWKFSSFC